MQLLSIHTHTTPTPTHHKTHIRDQDLIPYCVQIAQEMNNELGFPLSVCMEALSVSTDKNGAVDWVLERQV